MNKQTTETNKQCAIPEYSVSVWDVFSQQIDGRIRPLPSERHASDDDWDAYSAVNDPASGKKLPDEVHAMQTNNKEGDLPPPLSFPQQSILVTEKCVENILEIYGKFTASDDEYPAMGITIQGSPIFVECVHFPKTAVTRRKTSDMVERGHPDATVLWRSKLDEYRGECRTSTVHIHPMNLPALSSTDIQNFDSLRTNPDDPSTLPNGYPYPVLLVNLNSSGSLELLGFWIMNGRSYRTKVKMIRDDDPVVSRAWEHAEAMPFYSKECSITQRIDRSVSKTWSVELGINPVTQEKAIKAIRQDGKKVLIQFSQNAPLGLCVGPIDSDTFHIEEFVDWTRMLNTLVQKNESSSKRSETAGDLADQALSLSKHRRTVQS